VEANDIMMGLPERRGLGTFIWEPEANNANQALFVQGGGGGRGAGGFGAGRGRGAATATAPAMTGTAPATLPVATAPVAGGLRGRGGAQVVAVDPARMGAYDKVLEKYQLKRVP
jgi:hypothetical protein